MRNIMRNNTKGFLALLFRSYFVHVAKSGKSQNSSIFGDLDEHEIFIRRFRSWHHQNQDRNEKDISSDRQYLF